MLFADRSIRATRAIRATPDAAEDDGTAGLNFCSGEKGLGLHFGEDLFHEIVASHRYSAGHEQQIRLEALLDEFTQAARLIRSDRQQDRFASRLLDLRGE